MRRNRFHRLHVSILGLARSPTCRPRQLYENDEGFNTWAREEPNHIFSDKDFHHARFNTWAREEPNILPILGF